MLRTASAVTVIALSLATGALAGPKEDARAVVDKWAEAFSAGKADDVAALFRPDALLWGVASQSLASKPDQVKDYFVKTFARPISIRFKNQEAHVVSDSVVIEAGEADLTRPPETGGGAPAVISARYDMVLIRDGTGWKIAALHASRKPQ